MSERERDARDAHGDLTDWVMAVDMLADVDCDCGTDEPGTCLACVCERAMQTERKRAEKAEARIAEIEIEKEVEAFSLERENARLREDRFIAAAWVLDRAEQFQAASSTRAAFDEIMRGLAHGEHLAAHAHGELDDLIVAPFIVLARKALEGATSRRVGDQTIKALQNAQRILRDPECWAKGAAAFDDDGLAVDANSPRASRWCPLGALNHALFLEGLPLVELTRVHRAARVYLQRVLKMVQPPMDGRDVVVLFNDKTKTEHRHIMGLFDWAIALRKLELQEAP